MRSLSSSFLLLAACAAVSACADNGIATGRTAAEGAAPGQLASNPAATPQQTALESPAARANPVVPSEASALPTVYVHKTPTCGCCSAWVSHLQQSGFAVRTFDHDDLGGVKQRLGVPAGKGSCHTAEVGGYLVEGHVPASDIKRLLKEKPQAKGLVLPGMPMGSPGMESPDGRVEPYTVEIVELDGSVKAYSQHGS